MGKKDKEHRKKIQERNQKMKAADSAMQKLFQESMKRQLAELTKQREAEMSGDTQNQ
jgi:hypothetical protein